ncbi:MAG: phytanoyl-CoA dioxygenase family protein [Pseudomonadales bacterium]
MASKDKTPAQVSALREHLLAHNGLHGLELLAATDLDRAVRLFRRDGFVVIANILNDDQIAQLAEGCNEVIDDIVALDADQRGNRGSHRYSFGGSSLTRSQLHHPAWQMLLQLPSVSTLLDAIFGSPHYSLRAASGDFCLPGATRYQPLHSDIGDWSDDKRSPFSAFHDPRGHMTIRDLPCPYVCVNFLPQDVTRLNGPTRQIPGTQHSREPIPSLADEPEWMRLSTVCPAPAGSVLIRDVRAWHGGTPNLSTATRSIPNLEFYAPWFREPMVPGITRADFNKLSDRAKQLARFCVADSSEELITGAVLRAP